jgi:acetyl esterase
MEGLLSLVDGVYACCPFISNAYEERDPKLASLVENDAYMVNAASCAVLARLYSPDGSADHNPLAWPYQAADEDLRGLPGHVVSLNELDPLRDEGIIYARKLRRAGVRGYSRIVPGTPHAGDLLFAIHIPDVFDATLSDLKGFIQSCSSIPPEGATCVDARLAMEKEGASPL